jgi:hypothetical protein
MVPDPCFGSPKYFAVQAQCSNASAVVTHWDFAAMDAVFLPFYESVAGNASQPIISFSTQPAWMYSPTDWSYPQNRSTPYYGYSRGPASACNLTLIAAYYGRVFAWYTNGGFVDEAGEWHQSGHHLNISIAEVFNEVDYEHQYDVVTYTKTFDAIVRGIRQAVPPAIRRGLRFNGLSLPNIDDAAKVEAWVTYFVNASNHDQDCRDAINSIGYHAYPTNGPFTPDPKTFERMFTYVDAFISEVQSIDNILRRMSPQTETMLDECGTDMDNVLNASLPPPYDNVMYWVASGAYFAYLYGSVARMVNATVRVVGQSQLVDSYPQEPSVTMLDWASGRGTARYWVLQLLLESVSEGDALVLTEGADGSVFAQAFTRSSSRLSILLVNKKAVPVKVVVDVQGRLGEACAGSMIDRTSLLQPAHAIEYAVGSPLELPSFVTVVVQCSMETDQ